MPYPLTIIQPTDLVRDSRADINQNFSTLYSLVTAGVGTSGYSGFSGYQGSSGYSGMSGADGESGYSGISGYSGQSGYSGISGAITVTVNLSSHGFIAGDVIRNDGSADSYTKALADNSYNAEAVGIVTEILNPDNFIYTQYGSTTYGVPAVSANSVLFLSDTTPGLLTVTEPSIVGHVSKPMAIILASSVRMEVLNMRGVVIGAGSTFSQATLNNASTPYYITGNDCFLDFDASVSPLTAILPTAVNAAGKFYHIKKTDTSNNSITILTTSLQTIDGNSSILINSPWTSISLHSNNSNWLIF